MSLIEASGPNSTPEAPVYRPEEGEKDFRTHEDGGPYIPHVDGLTDQFKPEWDASTPKDFAFEGEEE